MRKQPVVLNSDLSDTPLTGPETLHTRGGASRVWWSKEEHYCVDNYEESDRGKWTKGYLKKAENMFKTWYSTNVMITFTYLLLLVLSTEQQMPIRDRKFMPVTQRPRWRWEWNFDLCTKPHLISLSSLSRRGPGPLELYSQNIQKQLLTGRVC